MKLGNNGSSDTSNTHNHTADEAGWEIVKTLLDSTKVDVNQPDMISFFTRAVEEGKTEIVQKFLSRNVNPDLLDKDGFAALHVALSSQMINLLIDHGANPNIKESNGFYPLHGAVGRKNQNLVESLLLGGANPHAKSNDGRTPLDIARAARNKELVKLLENTHTAHLPDNR